MFERWTGLAERSVMERLTLFANHVLRAEPAAMAKLAPHAGQVLAVELAGWPVMLPAPPSLAFRVTPPGLVEWVEEPGAALGDRPAALRVTVDAKALPGVLGAVVSGERPEVAVEGDPALAEAVQWVVDHVRWDVEEDLSRAIGDAPARIVSQVASTIAAGLRDAVRRIDAAAEGLGRAAPFGRRTPR